MSSPRVLAIVTEPLEGIEPIEEIRRRGNGDGVKLRIVVPAVEDSPFKHMLGDEDPAHSLAEKRLEASLAELGRHGVAAEGSIGDPDPVLAAQDALREEGADEILIFERTDGEARWFEDGLFERAKEELEPPLRMVVLRTGDADGAHVVGVEEAGRGTVPDDEGEVEISDNLPRFSKRDLSGIVFGLAGTLLAAVLAAATASGADSVAGAGAAAILIAIGIALINLAHVVGLTLFQSVHYHGTFARFFSTLALVGTPLAVLANLVLLIAS
jgi:hypothetical protein